MKLKMVDGQVALEDGKPVYVNDTGEEQTYDVGSLVNKISELNRESAKYRVRAKEIAAKVEGIDLDKAVAALDTVKALDEKKLIDAGKVEDIKTELSKGYRKQIEELKNVNTALIARNDEAMLRTAFESSEFIKEKTILSSDIAFSVFKDKFAVKDGAVQTKDTVLSQQNPGDPAGFDEAMSMFVNSRPDKTSIMKTNAGGSGSQGNSGGGANGANPFKTGDVTGQAALVKSDRNTAIAMANAAGKVVRGLND